LPLKKWDIFATTEHVSDFWFSQGKSPLFGRHGGPTGPEERLEISDLVIWLGVLAVLPGRLQQQRSKFKARMVNSHGAWTHDPFGNVLRFVRKLSSLRQS
jgi:hypothetical protein